MGEEAELIYALVLATLHESPDRVEAENDRLDRRVVDGGDGRSGDDGVLVDGLDRRGVAQLGAEEQRRSEATG